MNKPVSLIIARHGETAFNESAMGDDQRIRGWRDLPLTAQGRKDAEELADKVSGMPIEEILSSDLIRAEDTAKMVAEQFGLPVVVTMKLRPWNLGLMTGKPVKEVTETMDKFVTNENIKVPSGESFRDFLERLLPFVARMAHKAHTDNKTILLCTHTRCLQACKAWIDAGAGPDLKIDRATMDDYSHESGTGGYIEVLPHMILGPEFKSDSLKEDPDAEEG